MLDSTKGECFCFGGVGNGITRYVHDDPRLDGFVEGKDIEGEFRVDCKSLVPQEVALEFFTGTTEDHGPRLLEVSF